MKSLIVILALLPLPAAAVELPVRDTYCGDAIDVSAEGVNGEDFTCSPQSVEPDGTVALLCSHADPEWGPDWQTTAVIVEDTAAGVVRYSDHDGTLTLRRCQ